jgi:hypothetical protein
MDAKSAINKRVTFGNKKKILPNGKMVVLLQRLNFKGGTRPLTRVVSLFCTHLSTLQAKRLVVCGSGNARKDKLVSPERHHRPLLFNVQKKTSKMNENKRTAGETAMMGATYEERKNYMVQCLNESSTAILVYFDENCEIKTYGVAPKGDETALLTMLERAASRAKRVAEEVML